MARKFLTPVDLSKNELQNAVLQHVAGNPSGLVEGLFWWDSSIHQFKFYDGSATQSVGTSSAAGTVTTVSVVSANGFAGTVATPTTTPAVTVSTTVTGLLKGNGTAISAATAGTDYLAPAGNGSALTGITNSQVSGSAPLASPALTGTPTGPTATALTNTTQLATTAYADAATAVEKTRALAAEALLAPLASPALTGSPTAPTPTVSTGIANKGYVDATVQGLQVKPTATVVTTVALPSGTYANGTAGVGATFTVTATGTTTVDGHVLAANDLVLVTAQASAFQNGLYTVTTAGTTGVATVLTRHADMDQAAEFSGAFIPAGNTGTANANTLWLANPSGAVTVGTTAIPFTQLNSATAVTAGAGISVSGSTVAIENSGVLTVAHGGTGAATLTGLVKGNGSSTMTAAVAGTDYAAATSGSSILKGNGSGGFSSAKFTATIGDGSSTSIAVTHSLGTQDVIAQVRDATTNAVVDCDIVSTSSTVATFSFTTAPASNAYKAVIIG